MTLFAFDQIQILFTMATMLAAAGAVAARMDKMTHALPAAVSAGFLDGSRTVKTPGFLQSSQGT